VITPIIISDKSINYILVKFETDWCAPCNTLSAILIEVAQELEDKVKFCSMNIEENPDIPSKLGIKSIPTMILFNNGKVLDKKVGLHSKDVIVKWINDIIN
jgi:thioredoxin 1